MLIASVAEGLAKAFVLVGVTGFETVAQVNGLFVMKHGEVPLTAQ